ncbi:MAG: structural protein [Caudoviricetes sp.]|nr:MAG: structural protein [Caudoviricetes sp.]
MSNNNITNGITLDCGVFNELIGAGKDLVLINYKDFNLELTSAPSNRESNDLLGNLRGLTNIYLKPGALQYTFEGTDYSVIPTVTPEVREDGNLWYSHSINFTVYSKKSKDRDTLISLSRSLVIAVTKDRSTGLYELFGMYQGLRVSEISRNYTGAQNSNFYQVTISTPEIAVIKEPSLSELVIFLDNKTIIPTPIPTPGVYGDATPTVQGLVRVDKLSPNPIVYTKETSDTLFELRENKITTEVLLEENKNSTKFFPALKAITSWIQNRFEPKLTVSDSTKYYRGDKTWQILTKESIGLGNVDNTSDDEKPVPESFVTALSDKVDLKTVMPLKSRFTLVQKITDNPNNIIELGDYAKGFGPGIGTDSEWWSCAEYLNLLNDGDIHNYLNYRPIFVTLPNS